MNTHKEESSFDLLTRTTNGYIGVCQCCQDYNFVYKNVLITFRQDELLRFGEWLESIRFHDDTLLPLAHGRSRVYTSPMSNLFLAFQR